MLRFNEALKEEIVEIDDIEVFIPGEVVLLGGKRLDDLRAFSLEKCLEATKKGEACVYFCLNSKIQILIQMLSEKTKELESLPLYLEDSPADMEYINEMCCSAECLEEKKLNLIVIDDIECILTGDTYTSFERGLETVLAKLRKLAKMFKATVLLTTELSDKKVTNRYGFKRKCLELYSDRIMIIGRELDLSKKPKEKNEFNVHWIDRKCMFEFKYACNL